MEPVRRGPRRPPPRPVEVVSIERLTSRMLSIVLGGESLATFTPPPPTAHIKLFLPDSSGDVAVPEVGPEGLVWPNGRPTMRTYTPRHFDAEARTLEVWFVLHGDGPAARWAATAKPGDRAAIGGPGGRLAVDPTAARWWIGGDESALPAVATLIEAMPAGASAEVHLEVDGAEDELELPTHPGVTATWHHRAGAGWGEALTAAVQPAHLDEETHVWVACEAAAVRRIRAHLLTDRSLPRAQVTTRGYWRTGEANHPDHDFGED
jgi:NADPH-dependent ferric siderophore reductase